MTVRYNDTLKGLILNAMRSQIAGTLRVYPGAPPPTADFPTTEPVLVQFTLAYGTAAANGRIGLSNAPIASEVLATGVAAWFRMTNGSVIFDGTISTEGGGGDCILTATSLVQGEMVAVKKMDFSIL